MVTTIIIFIAILSLLVFVHELGHFIVAKRSGMKVDEFGFGFPPRLIGIEKHEGKWRMVWGGKRPQNPEGTVYSINAIPLGGFVKIVGENNDEESDPRSFTNKPFSRRLLTLLAGVLMNVLLAWFLISVGYSVGLPVAVDDVKNIPHGSTLLNPNVALIEVLPDGPAGKQGLLAGDIVDSVDGKTFGTPSELQEYIRGNKGKVFTFAVTRGDQQLTKDVQSQAEPPPDQGATGIALAQVGTLRFPVYQAVWQGARTTVSQLGAILKGLYTVFSSKAGLQSLGGPVKIAQITGQVADLGLIYLLQFTAFLSLNLAILNSLPFPALDGGRVLFLLIEKVRGKKNNQAIEQWANTIGFVLLLLLMLVVTIRDVRGL